MSTMNLKISIAPARVNMKVTFGSGANAAAYLETLVASIARGPEGPQGPQGEGLQGPRGIQGPQGETAVANINFRGSYVPGTPYYHADVNGDTDVVRSPLDGNTYYCLVDNTGNEPSTSPTYWTLFVMQGGRGEQGEQGDKGDKGDRGPAGESIPKKAVMMFAGGADEVPEGFWLCNGDDVPGYGRVPDLRSRFVVGLDPRATDHNAVGKTGGASSVLLSGAQSGVQAHDHDVPASTGKVDGTGSQQGIKPPGTIKIKTSLSVAKDATEAHENRPPYYTLAFIIRVAPPAPTVLTVYQVSATDDSCDGVMNTTTYLNEGKSEFLIPVDMDLTHEYTIFDGGVMVEPTINQTTRVATFDPIPLGYNGAKKNKITYKYYPIQN